MVFSGSMKVGGGDVVLEASEAIMAIDLNLFTRGQVHVMFPFGCRYSLLIVRKYNFDARREPTCQEGVLPSRQALGIGWILWWIGFGDSAWDLGA